MTRRDRNRLVMMWIAVTLALSSGCASTRSAPKEHASSSLLDSGPTPKVSNSQAADLQIALGRSMEDEGKFDEARPAYLAALKKDPKRADAEVRLAILDDRKGDTAAADLHFAKALKLQPKDPEILCDRGYSFYLRRRWAEAEASLKGALAIDPHHSRSHANLGLVLARQGDSAAALAEFARAGCDPSDARANLGLVLALEGRFEESRREYALALKAKPGSSVAQEGLRASATALTGKANARMIAANGKPSPSVDPALQRTSAPSTPQ
jgi:Tfp pilus assembly protein PilF